MSVDNNDNTPQKVVVRRPRQVVVLQWGLLILGVFYTLYLAQDVFIPIAVAILFNFVLSPLVRFLQRAHIPPALSAASVVLGFLGCLTWAGYMLVEPANEWLSRAPSSLSEVSEKAEALLQPIEDVKEATEQLDAMASMMPDGQEQVIVREESVVSPMLDKTQSFLGLGLLMIILLYFLLASGDSFVRKLASLEPDAESRQRIFEIAHEVERSISRYLMTVSVVNICLGVVTGLVMWAFGMPNPVLWGAIAGLFNFVPYVGPVATAAVLAFVSFMTFDSLIAIALPPLCFLFITAVEGQLLYPLIHGRGLLLSPVIIFVALICWGWMWGIAGVFMAIPILIVLRVIAEHVQPLRPLFVLLSE